MIIHVIRNTRRGIIIFEEFQPFVCTFEIENGQNTQKQTIQAPQIMLINQFVSYMQEAAKAPQPVGVKMSRNVPVYDSINDRQIGREVYIAFINNAYEKQNGGFKDG